MSTTIMKQIVSKALIYTASTAQSSPAHNGLFDYRNLLHHFQPVAVSPQPIISGYPTNGFGTCPRMYLSLLYLKIQKCSFDRSLTKRSYLLCQQYFIILVAFVIKLFINHCNLFLSREPGSKARRCLQAVLRLGTNYCLQQPSSLFRLH